MSSKERARVVEATWPEWLVPIAAKPSDTSRDPAQTCGSHGPAAATTRKETATDAQTHLPAFIPPPPTAMEPSRGRWDTFDIIAQLAAPETHRPRRHIHQHIPPQEWYLKTLRQHCHRGNAHLLGNTRYFPQPR